MSKKLKETEEALEAVEVIGGSLAKVKKLADLMQVVADLTQDEAQEKIKAGLENFKGVGAELKALSIGGKIKLAGKFIALAGSILDQAFPEKEEVAAPAPAEEAPTA